MLFQENQSDTIFCHPSSYHFCFSFDTPIQAYRNALQMMVSCSKRLDHIYWQRGDVFGLHHTHIEFCSGHQIITVRKRSRS